MEKAGQVSLHFYINLSVPLSLLFCSVMDVFLGFCMQHCLCVSMCRLILCSGCWVLEEGWTLTQTRRTGDTEMLQLISCVKTDLMSEIQIWTEWIQQRRVSPISSIEISAKYTGSDTGGKRFSGMMKSFWKLINWTKMINNDCYFYFKHACILCIYSLPVDHQMVLKYHPWWGFSETLCALQIAALFI